MEPVKAFLVVVQLLGLLFLCRGGAYDFCQTSRKERGKCQTITKCSVFHPILNGGHISADDIKYLRESRCGWDGRLPKVCCPIQVVSESNSLLPSLDVCGIETEDRIFGGIEADLKEYPWMAMLQYRYDNGTLGFSCGGSLINNRYILTAGHCLKGLETSLVNVRLGEHNIDTDLDCIKIGNKRVCINSPIDVQVEEIIIHEGYTRRYYNDIGLIRLAKEVQFSDFIRPICLPISEQIQKSSLNNKRLVVSGWGRTEYENASPIKLKLEVSIKSNAYCASFYRRLGYKLTNNQLCAGGERGKDSCTGDSGGPLMRLFKDRKKLNWYCIGVVSFGLTNCAQDEWPGVYTKVDNYIKWIVSKLRP